MNSEQHASAVQTAASELLPIREVARLTGVNPVTLRAWERRYGLIRPLRTDKGHRLYSASHLRQIRDVLAWLARGVAVSQISALLQDAPATQPDGALWAEEQQGWLECIEQLAERRLDDRFNRILALYPAETLCRHLLLPLLAQLHQRWGLLGGVRVEQVFFLSWLRSKLEMRLYHANCMQAGAPLLLLSVSEQSNEPGLWLCAWLASNSGCPVRVLDRAIPSSDLPRALQLITPRAVLFHCDQRMSAPYLQQFAAAQSCPQLLCGVAATIHHEALRNSPHVHLADSPLSALHCLQRLNLTARC